MWRLGGERLYFKFCASNIVCIPELCTLKVYFSIWLNFIIQCYLMAEVRVKDSFFDRGTLYLFGYLHFTKIRLCVVDLKGQFQTTLRIKDIIFLIWKFRPTILIFLLFFAGIVKSSAFWTLSMLFLKVWNIWFGFLRQIAI